MLATAVALAFATFGPVSCAPANGGVPSVDLRPGYPFVQRLDLPPELGEARANPEPCTLLIDNTRRTRWTWPELCTAVAHEWRHLQGYWNSVGFGGLSGAADHDHSPNPRSLMYPTTIYFWPRCFPRPFRVPAHMAMGESR